MKRVQIAVLASGNGTNAEALMRHFKDSPHYGIALLASNRKSAFALERARAHLVPTYLMDKSFLNDPGPFIAYLDSLGIGLIVLAGFLWKVPLGLVAAFPGRILNLHPSLLPRHGGKGMYGHHVHQSVIDHGDPKSGITVHWVNERFDEGRQLFQASCPVFPSDTPESLADKIHRLEQRHFPTVVEMAASIVAGYKAEGRSDHR